MSRGDALVSTNLGVNARHTQGRVDREDIVRYVVADLWNDRRSRLERKTPQARGYRFGGLGVAQSVSMRNVLRVCET